MSSKYRSRTKARRLSENSREYKLLSRLGSGDCLYCPPNHNENHHGKHSKWGRKKASRREYTQGKTRSRAWVENITYIGKQEVVILETDTHTYIADGYPMHNCQDVNLLEKIYNRLLPFADNHPNMALAAGIDYICPRCGHESDFVLSKYRKTGTQVNAIQVRCKHCNGYVTRRLTAEERQQLEDTGSYKAIFRNITT